MGLSPVFLAVPSAFSHPFDYHHLHHLPILWFPLLVVQLLLMKMKTKLSSWRRVPAMIQLWSGPKRHWKHHLQWKKKKKPKNGKMEKKEAKKDGRTEDKSGTKVNSKQPFRRSVAFTPHP